jgi:hypothetical protein
LKVKLNIGAGDLADRITNQNNISQCQIVLSAIFFETNNVEPVLAY